MSSGEKNRMEKQVTVEIPDILSPFLRFLLFPPTADGEKEGLE